MVFFFNASKGLSSIGYSAHGEAMSGRRLSEKLVRLNPVNVFLHISICHQLR